MRDGVEDPRPDATVEPEPLAHDLDDEGEADPEKGAREDVGGPVHAEVDAARGHEQRERRRGGPSAPPEAQRRERGKGERAGGVSARERRVELHITSVSGDRVHVRQDVAWTRPVDPELEDLRDDDRDSEEDQEVERRLPMTAPPQRDRDERDDVRRPERRHGHHEGVRRRVRAREVQRAKERLVEARRGRSGREERHASAMPGVP